MRRIATAAVLSGVGVLIVRAIVPKLNLHERAMAGCERMFQQMPEEFPPKRMMRGIEEIRASTARTLELLEERTPAGEAEPPPAAPSTQGGRGGGNELRTDNFAR